MARSISNGARTSGELRLVDGDDLAPTDPDAVAQQQLVERGTHRRASVCTVANGASPANANCTSMSGGKPVPIAAVTSPGLTTPGFIFKIGVNTSTTESRGLERGLRRLRRRCRAR